jgi:hypothetical protein
LETLQRSSGGARVVREGDGIGRLSQQLLGRWPLGRLRREPLVAFDESAQLLLVVGERGAVLATRGRELSLDTLFESGLQRMLDGIAELLRRKR